MRPGSSGERRIFRSLFRTRYMTSTASPCRCRCVFVPPALPPSLHMSAPPPPTRRSGIQAGPVAVSTTSTMRSLAVLPSTQETTWRFLVDVVDMKIRVAAVVRPSLLRSMIFTDTSSVASVARWVRHATHRDRRTNIARLADEGYHLYCPFDLEYGYCWG